MLSVLYFLHFRRSSFDTRTQTFYATLFNYSQNSSPQIVPEPHGISDNLDDLAKVDLNFIDKNGVEQKIVELNDDGELDEEEKMMAPNEDEVERAKRLLKLIAKK